MGGWREDTGPFHMIANRRAQPDRGQGVGSTCLPPPSMTAVITPADAGFLTASLVRTLPLLNVGGLLFTVPMEGRDAFVYVLVEHQSSSDPLNRWFDRALIAASAADVFKGDED